ncbi:MAG: AAA family ATPase [Ammonifex sp.]|nr:MAG: AAA family ATPase [Ammonifex sp.]
MPNSLSLKVQEMSGDESKGFVRVDPSDMGKIGLWVGDVVAVEGQRRTLARAMPLFAEDRGKGLAQLDAGTCVNARVSAGDMVTVSAAQPNEARKIVLKGAAGPGQVSTGLPLLTGDEVVLRDGKGRLAERRLVLRTVPDGDVFVTSGTVFEFCNGTVKQSSEGYDQIGGLTRELARVREVIELPLRYPEAFPALGIDPPRGVLLYGPPGTGKTLIARAVATETNARFIAISGPEILNKYYGESEARLREIFAKASNNPPAIIFIDEIDAIAPKREDVSGEVEKRVVAQLLALLDGLKARNGVVVVGATNLPNNLDPALRRPGRFDREIFIGVPDTAGRHEILTIHTREMPLADDVDLARLADVTYGFVGADLKALCREAAMHCLREFFQNRTRPARLHWHDIKVNAGHFAKALRDIEPSCTREFQADSPRASWADIGGYTHLKDALTEAVIWPQQHKELMNRAGVHAAKGILLYGPPGTGKTLLARATAGEAGINFIAVNAPSLLSKWVGEAEKAIRNVFRKARQASPCLLFFDEVDALVSPVRGGSTADRSLSQFLTELDGMVELHDVTVMAATNRIDALDPALLRSGRLELHMKVDKPDTDDRRAILGVHTRQMPLGRDVDLAELSAVTAGYSGADLRLICQKAGICAVRDYLAVGVSDPAHLCVSRGHFLKAIQDMADPERGG